MASYKTFSVAVTGKGRFLGMLITDGMKAFPRAQWFDRSDQANKAIGNEVNLGIGGLLNQASQAIWGSAQQNLSQPSKTDVTVNVQSRGASDQVSIVGRRGKQEIELGGAGATMQSIQAQVDGVMQMIDSIT